MTQKGVEKSADILKISLTHQNIKIINNFANKKLINKMPKAPLNLSFAFDNILHSDHH